MRLHEQVATKLIEPVQPPRRPTTVREAAEALGISRSQVYMLMGAGELGYIKIRRSRRVPWEAIEELLAKCTVTAK
jgi:excisionase family DNA binding protein